MLSEDLQNIAEQVHCILPSSIFRSRLVQALNAAAADAFALEQIAIPDAARLDERDYPPNVVRLRRVGRSDAS